MHSGMGASMAATVDLFDFCRLAHSASGAAALRDLGRLDVAEREGTLAWYAEGGRDDKGRPVLRLDVGGRLKLVCQRCLEPLTFDLDVHAAYRVVRSEAEAEELPLEEEDFDPVVGSAQFDLVGLAEEEVILSLPPVPRHEVCPVKLAAGQVAEAPVAKKPSPFAGLKEALKAGKKD